MSQKYFRNVISAPFTYFFSSESKRKLWNTGHKKEINIIMYIDWLRRRKFFPFSRHFFFQFTKEKKSRLRSYVEKKEERTKDREGKILLNFRVRRLTLSK